MKYLRLYKESQNELEEPKLDSKFIEDLEEMKYLPYKDFMKSLKSKIGDSEFMSKLISLGEISGDSGSGFGKVEYVDLEVKLLVPTQSQIGLMESLAWLQNIPSIQKIVIDNKATLFDNNRIFVVNKRWILDGHHRFAYVRMLNKNATIPCINITIPEQSINNIMKDIQISLLSTYGDIYTKESVIDKSISMMSDDDIYNSIYGVVEGIELEELKSAYAQTDFSKAVSKIFIPKSLLKESIDPLENDYLNPNRSTNIPLPKEEEEDDEDDKDEDVKEIEETDNEKNPLNYAADILGVIDPTGAVDILNGISYLYQGHIFSAVCSFASAIPGVDFFAKPVANLAFQVSKGVARSTFYKISLKRFGKALTKFDSKKAARQWLKMEKEAYKKTATGQFLDPKLAQNMDEFNKTMDVLLTQTNKVTKIIGSVMEKIGNNWLKFRLFYWLWGSKIVKFLEELANWRQNLKYWMEHIDKEEVIGILASNAISIKRDIVDNKVDKYNQNYAEGIHPLQAAIKTKKLSSSDMNRGVPELFLKKLPTILNNLKGSEVEDIEAQIQTYREYDPERQEMMKKSQIEAQPITPPQPEVSNIPLNKEVQIPIKNAQPTKDTITPVIPKVQIGQTQKEKDKEFNKPKVEPIKSDTTNIKPKTGKIKKITEF